jgi:hypothetical protein
VIEGVTASPSRGAQFCALTHVFSGTSQGVAFDGLPRNAIMSFADPKLAPPPSGLRPFFWAGPPDGESRRELDLGGRTLLLRERGQKSDCGVHDVGRLRRGRQVRDDNRKFGPCSKANRLRDIDQLQERVANLVLGTCKLNPPLASIN